MNRLIAAFCLIAWFVSNTYAQEITIQGTVRDGSTGDPLSFVSVFNQPQNLFTETNDKGFFELSINDQSEIELTFSRVGFQEEKLLLKDLKSGETRKIAVDLKTSESDVQVEVVEDRIEDEMINTEMEDLELLPNVSGNIESLLTNIGLGVSSGTGGELSSQYNVRGGNFDENLVYVNGFEIYRPQLIRSSLQEGLSFANPDLIGSLKFSSGGFESKYGDKLSSVLDIKYKTPERMGGSIQASALGASGHFEGAFLKNNNGIDRLRVLLGARYKTTSYLLGTLDTEGEYIPNFSDFQAYVTYDFNPVWQAGLIANYNRSEYQFTPVSRSTAFGLINFALQLNSVFQGQQVDDFTTAMTGVSLSFRPEREENPLFMKLLVSGFRSLENERQDILGFYRLGESSRTLTGGGGDEIANVLGTGTQHNYARNYLSIDVINAALRGAYENEMRGDSSNSILYEWGVKWQQESISDEINEWERLDSAGYSLFYSDQEVELFQVLKSEIDLKSNRFSGFGQINWHHTARNWEYQFIAGVRSTYWDVNNELNVSPRLKVLFKPRNSEKDISYRVSAGYYIQAPFYRELRNRQGFINQNLQAQKSIHLVGGLSYNFYWGSNPKPFKFITEVYYKHLWDLVSYDVDNVKIRYSGVNDATGYVIGADFRINGEFVPGAESWFNVSILSARESLDGVDHLRREIGDSVGQVVNTVPRPSDQTVRASIFFQDYLPRNENIKTHLNFSFGTGLPFGIRNDNEEYRNTFRYPIYHRTDLGFSFQLWNKEWRSKKPNHFLRFTQNAWLSLEIYNLMQVRNEASKTWIKTVFLQEFAVPNYLTSRRVNLRLRFQF